MGLGGSVSETEQSTGLWGTDPTLERRGLRDHVYDRILNGLMRGEIDPGSRLSIDTIARELAVSPTPVREAMVQLERTGLVTREAHKGYRVAPPLSRDQLEELFEARMMLETTATALATPHRRLLLAELRQAEAEHRRAGGEVIAAIARGDADDVALTTSYFSSDAAFHQVIFDHCGNHYIRQMSETLGAQLHRLRQTVLRGVDDVNEAIAEHESIVAAFESGAPDAPERAMRAHIAHVRSRSLAAER